MKKLWSTWMFVLVFALMSGTAFAIGYCKDIAPTDPPDKTFDDEWTMNVGGEIEFDVYINDVPESLTYAGVWISYGVSPVAIFPNDLQIYDGVNGPPGPWDPALTYISPPCGGLPPCPTIVFVGNVASVNPDQDGDIILGRIRVRSLYEGYTDVFVSTFPSIDTVIGESETVYDPQIIPNTMTIHQVPPPSCECIELASDHLTNIIVGHDPDKDIQFTPVTTGTCEPHNWQYSDGCTEGDVNPESGLFTAGAITVDELCTVTATDQANPGVTCYAEVHMILQVGTDYDMDGVANYEDNCINTPNGWLGGTCTSGNVGEFCDFINEDCGINGFCSENQEDSYPPQGNNIGDACDCEGNFDCHRDADVDGTDAATFKIGFGRNTFNNPCTNEDQCQGDFDCDMDVDGTDAALFKQDFGRSAFNNPCPVCVVGDWCDYGMLIDNPTQLLAILNSLEYEYASHFTSGHLPITEDIQIIGEITISSEDLAVPEECTSLDDCRLQVSFADQYGTLGIELSPDSLTLTLTNINLRFRSLVYNVHPGPYNYMPVIQIMPPSTHACESSEIRCAFDQVCYDNSGSFCSYCPYCQNCLELTPWECVCRDEEGVYPDGTYCELWISDMLFEGECLGGVCMAPF